MKFNKKIIMGCFLAAGIFMSTTVYGEEIKSRNGIMTIEAPDGNWRVTEAETSRTTLTDGENVITMCHFSNGEKLPEIKTADEEYTQVCQNIISTKDEVFVITGLAVDPDDFKKIQEAVQSTVINKYGTKKAVNKADNTEMNQSTGAKQESDDTGANTDSQVYTVKAADFTGWADGQSVNVRGSYSTASEIIGTLHFQDEVSVTAEVRNATGDTEWYQIDYEGQTGYVYAKYISRSSNEAEQTETDPVGEHREIFYIGGNGSADIYKAEDGDWYDDFGRRYTYEGEGYWLNVADDTIWADLETLTAPADQNAVEEVDIASEEGLDFDTIYLSPYGIWKNTAGEIFTENGDHTFTGRDGTRWYTFDN